ncbi:MAG: Acylneuraminate cytidylyltransferase [uncultured bacterium]|nr:MAG: Acylneuraminate cytidylyltransferase [uncultured bacterium]
MYLKDIKPLVGIFVQARLNSTRFPGKIMKKLYNNTTVLDFLLKRLSLCKRNDKLVIATTDNPKDDLLVKWLHKNNYKYFRGSESNCLKRFYDAAILFNIDFIVRITSDCPLVPPDLVDSMIQYYIKNFHYIDYLSNRQFTNYPEGVDIEIFKTSMLAEALKNNTVKNEEEHINYYFLNRPEKYRLRYFMHKFDKDYSRFKLSIDTPSDLKDIRNIFRSKKLALNFSTNDLLKVLD